jgi:hypothetical protein
MPLSPAAKGKEVIRLVFICSTTISREGIAQQIDHNQLRSPPSFIFFLELSPFLIQLKEHSVLVNT